MKEKTKYTTGLNEDDLDYKDDSYTDFDRGFNSDYRELSEAQTNLLKSLLNFDTRIKNIIISWMALVWDEHKQQYVTNKEAEPIMNLKGVNFFVDLYRTFLNETNTLTTITKEAYHEIMEDVIVLTWDNLAIRGGTEFGIKSKGDMLKIGTQVESSIKLMLLSLKGTGIKGVLRDNYEMRENNKDQHKEESGLSKISRKLFGAREDF
jgi:hypothetical protein